MHFMVPKEECFLYFMYRITYMANEGNKCIGFQDQQNN